MSTKRFIYFVLGTVAIAMMATATQAAAHVTVQPGAAAKGGFAKIAFRVPNESDTAGTIKLEVTFPTDTPIGSVRTKPTAGWTVERRMETLPAPVQSGESEITEVVRTVTWTAQPGVRIGPGEFTEFEVSAGRLPENTDRLIIPAVQTYDDGDVVRWDAPPPAEGAEEPERPAPVLELVADESGDSADAAANDQPAGAQSSGDTAQPTSGTDNTARWLAGIGIAAGALGLGFGLGGILAGRRQTRVQ